MSTPRDSGSSTPHTLARGNRPSLLMAGIGQRLAGAAALLVLLWLAVGWALGGAS